tara:strand:+ start:110 stop:337 length:228 start_codon:yes stop_codon:yes gene_type:complete
MKANFTKGELAFMMQALAIVMSDEACGSDAERVAKKIHDKMLSMLEGGYKYEPEVQPDVDWDADLGKLLQEGECD